MPFDLHNVTAALSGCRHCADRFAATATGHAPRPILHLHPAARIVIASQAPGARAHASGVPFRDPSGARLRDWMGLSEDAFFAPGAVAVVPMGFCFPGQDAEGNDLRPPAICAQMWQDRVLSALSSVRLTLVIGAVAQRQRLGRRGPMTETVRGWRDHAPNTFPLPHPSWRNTPWLRRNPWFEAELLPALRQRVAEVLAE